METYCLIGLEFQFGMMESSEVGWSNMNILDVTEHTFKWFK